MQGTGVQGRIVTAALAVLVLAAGLAGCGGDDDGATPTTSVVEATTTTTAAAQFSGDRDSPFCVQARAWRAMGPIDGTKGEAARPDYEAQAAALHTLVPIAPPEIAADVATAVGVVDELIVMLQGNGWDADAIDQDVLVSPEEAVAQDRMSTYIDTVCQPG